MPARVGPRWRGVWALVVCVGLLLVPAGSASPQTVDVARRVTPAQIDPDLLEPICRTIRSLQPGFAGFPAVAAVLSSLLQSLGCAGAPATTTSTVVVTTTAVPPTTTPATSTTVGTGPTTTMPPTTLPPCIPNNPVPTTVPCVPATSTTVGTGPTTSTPPTTTPGPVPTTTTPGPTTSTTLGPCIPNNPVPTTVPCIPVTSIP